MQLLFLLKLIEPMLVYSVQHKHVPKTTFFIQWYAYNNIQIKCFITIIIKQRENHEIKNLS